MGQHPCGTLSTPCRVRARRIDAVLMAKGGATQYQVGVPNVLYTLCISFCKTAQCDFPDVNQAVEVELYDTVCNIIKGYILMMNYAPFTHLLKITGLLVFERNMSLSLANILIKK